MTKTKIEFLTLDMHPCPLDRQPDRFGFECPMRPGEMCSGMLLVGADMGDGRKLGRGESGQRPAMWNWNGDRNNPSFTPSVNCLAERNGEKLAGCGWHGYITNGEAKSV